MAETFPIIYGLSQRPKSNYPPYIQQFVSEVDQEGKLVTPEDHEHMMHGSLLYDLVIFFNAQHVVEIGMRDGKSTRIIVEALRTTHGHLTLIDLNAGDSCKEVSQEDQQQYVTKISQRDMDVESTEPINICFVDHLHGYWGTRNTCQKFWPLITTPGALLIADGDAFCDQAKAVRNFAEHQNIGYLEESRAQGHALFLKPPFPTRYRDSKTTYHLFEIADGKWKGGKIIVDQWNEEPCF